MQTEKQFTATVKAIVKNGAKLAADIQACCITAIAQSHNANPNHAERLVGALHKSQRAEAVKKYLMEFGCLQWDKEAGKMVYRKRKDFTPETGAALLAKAEQTTYYDFTKEVAATESEYDFLAHIVHSIKVAKALQSGNKQGKYGSVSHTEKLAAIEGILGNDAAAGMVLEGNVVAIAEGFGKRADAMEIFKALGDKLGFDMTFPEQQEEKKAA